MLRAADRARRRQLLRGAGDASRELEANRQVIFRYTDAHGDGDEDGQPERIVNNIAGICNRARNVVGLMPHPERACEASLGSADGRVVLQSVVQNVRRSWRS